MTDLQDIFFKKLIKRYGEWDKNGARFGKHSYGEIADDLSISGSQFSKLLYSTATNGMYERTIKNIERLLEKEQLKLNNKNLSTEVEKLKNDLSNSAKNNTFNYKYLVLAVIICSAITFFLGRISDQASQKPISINDNPQHALSDFFDPDFNSTHISPFLSTGEAQAFCPCSAFEGSWSLAKQYTIPVPIGKPGLYYVAKAVDLKIKCYRNVADEKKGKVFIGFEEMEHELWIDINREPISPKYFDFKTKNYTKEFFNIDFEQNPSFQKIANIRSFMFEYFELSGDKINRKGEPVGRFANEINEQLCIKYEINVQDVMENIIGNLVKTVCNPAVNNYCNPNELVENESVISFNCDFTIAYENLGIGGSYPYTKSLLLLEQNYSDNLLCDCNE